MNALPTTGELFATNQVSPDTERCYRNQLRHFASWMENEQGKTEIEDVILVDLLAYKQRLTHLVPSTQLIMGLINKQTVSNFIPYLIMLISMKEEMECSHIGQIVWYPN